MRRAIFTVLTVLLGAGFVVGVGTYFSWASPESSLPVQEAQVVGTETVNGKSMPHAVLEISSWADSMASVGDQGRCHGPDGGEHPDWVTFCPTTDFAVPANALVTIRVSQYDGGEVITNPYFAKVHGTVDGTAKLTMAGTNESATFTAIPPDTVGHTFTIHGVTSSSQPTLFVSVPLMASAFENEVPNVIEFSFLTGDPGTYYWNCEFPCGDGTYANFGGPMSQQGYMAGRFEVV